VKVDPAQASAIESSRVEEREDLGMFRLAGGGKAAKRVRISARPLRWPQASSPMMNGWHTTWSSLRRAFRRAFPFLRWSIQTEVSARVMLRWGTGDAGRGTGDAGRGTGASQFRRG